MDFQSDPTVDGTAVKIASIDEHTRLSLMNSERSISEQRLIEEVDKTFALWGGPPLVLRMDNGPVFISSVLQQFCVNRVGISYIPPGTPYNNGHIETFDNRLRKECLNRNHWISLLEARVVQDIKATTIIGTATRRWATSRRPSTLPSAPTRTNRRMDARSTETNQTAALKRGRPTIGDLQYSLSDRRGPLHVFDDDTVSMSEVDEFSGRALEWAGFDASSGSNQLGNHDI